jgi:nucleoside-diphosphate-sugar epimerase
MPTVAVTGATGFIGRRLLHGLAAAGYGIRALVRGTPPSDAPAGVAWIRGDLADSTALSALLAGADAVIHGAGAVKALDRDAFMAANAVGTARLADLAAAQTASPRFVHVSSFAARAPHLSAYAASKAAGEKAVLAHGLRLPAVVLRPPAVYGPGDREALRVLRMAARGVLLVPDVPGARLSLVHVDDAVAAVLAALVLPALPAGPVEFDDHAAEGYSWVEIAAAAAAALRRPVRTVAVPAAALHLAGAVAGGFARLRGRASVLSRDKVGEILHPDWVARTPRLPGYQPRWPLRPGFENTAEWAASRGLLRL